MKELSYRSQVRKLEAIIEKKFESIKYLHDTNTTRIYEARLIEMYAREYKRLTGNWYVRDYNN